MDGSNERMGCRATILTLVSLLLFSAALCRCGSSVPVKDSTTSIARTLTTPPPVVTSSSVMPWNNKTAVRVDVCVLNACEAYVRMRDDLANAVRPINEKLHGDGTGGSSGLIGDKNALLEARLQRLDRRLRSVEQPGE